jgi:hypothetical protein
LVSTFSDLAALVANEQKIDTKKVLIKFAQKAGQFTIAAGLTESQYAQAVAVKNNRHTVLSAVSSLRRNVKMHSHFVLFYFTGCRVKHGMTTPLKPITTPHPHNDNLPQSCHDYRVKNVA